MKLIEYINKLAFNKSDVIHYGTGEIIKRYAKYPVLLPLPCHVEHGWTAFPNALKSDLITKKKLMLVYSRRRAKAWTKQSKMEVEILGAPFILYRRMNNIKRDKNATGTVAYPGHSTNDIRSDFNMIKYCEELEKLPQSYQPVTVCLHYLDVKRGRDKIYRDHGFKVVSAGSRHDITFVKRFYDILSSHKYATSNDVGSHTFYAVELDVPFFLLGDIPVAVNETGKDPNINKKTTISGFYFGAKAMKLFSTGPIKKILPAQRKFVLSEMGIGEVIDSESLNKVLWSYFYRDGFFITAVPIHFALSVFRFIKSPFQRL